MKQSSIFQDAAWIVPGSFEALEPKDYLAPLEKWTFPEPEQLTNLHTVYRASFSKPRGKTVIRITADDCYKLYINGVFVGQGPTPGYHFHYHWNEFDITEFLREGENEIRAECYYQGYVNYAWVSSDRRLGLIAAVFSEGEYVFGTGSHWQCALDGRFFFTHTMGYDTITAENADLRRSPLAFEDCACHDLGYRFAPTPARAVEVYDVYPVSQEAIPGGILYDFGTEITAGLRLRLRGTAGETVRILCAEELEDTPLKLRYDMRCGCRSEELLILAQGENDYTQFEYKGFRYAAVLPEKGAEILSVTARVRHYPFDDDYCNLETEDPVLKTVWDICKRSVKYGCQEAYIDCPTREKGAYLGDAVITSAAQLVLTGDPSLLRHAMDNFTVSGRICPVMMGVAAGGIVHEIADYSLQFPILALRYYRYTRDKAYLRKDLEAIEGMLGYFRRYARADGLLEDVTGQWNLVDWPENLRDGYDFPLTRPMAKGSGCHNVLNAFYVGCVIMTEHIRDLLDIPYEKRGDTLKQAFNREFYKPELGYYTDCKATSHASVHSNILPLFYGLCDKSWEQQIADLLMEKGMVCGVYMAWFFLKALCRAGRLEDAYSLIVSQGENSWYNMVREGGTTCFEAWGKDKKYNTSLCHPWACGPVSVLAEDILPSMPQIGRLRIRNERAPACPRL